MAEGKNERKFLSDALLVAAASALSYAVAYSYRSGFASYFDLPPLLLTPTLGAVLRAGAAVGAVVLIFSFTALLFLPQKNTALSSRIYTLFLLLVFLALVNYSLFTSIRGWLSLVGVLCFLGFFEFVWPLITQPQVAGYKNKLLAQDNFDAAQNTFWDRIGNRYGYKGVGLVVAVLVLIFVAHSVGYSNAKEQEDFFVLADAPGYVVAAMDDDVILLVAYDPATMTLKRAYTIRRLASEHVWQLEKKHIGKLVQPEPLNRKSKK